MLHLKRYGAFRDENRLFSRKDTVGTQHKSLILAMDSLTLFSICDYAIYFRLNSIDMKYQVWKLGVVFTDNVSLVVSYI